MAQDLNKIDYSDIVVRDFQYSSNYNLDEDLLFLKQEFLLKTLNLFLQDKYRNSSKSLYVLSSEEFLIKDLLKYFFNKNKDKIKISCFAQCKESGDFAYMQQEEIPDTRKVLFEQLPIYFFNDNLDVDSVFGYFKTTNGIKTFVPGALFKYRIVAFDSKKIFSNRYLAEKIIYALDDGFVFLGSDSVKLPILCNIVLYGCDYEDHIRSKFGDSSFKKIFGLIAESQEEFNFVEDDIYSYCSWLNTIAKLINLDLDDDCYPLLIKKSFYITQDKNKFSLAGFNFQQFIYQAALFSKNSKVSYKNFSDFIDYRYSLYKDISSQFLNDYFFNYVKIDTSGSVVGQINSLAIIDHNSYFYGIPSRVTANVYAGDGEIVHIDRKSDLSSSIHTKSTYIISSALHNMMSSMTSLDISGNITFEQSYSEIDGDSATAAEFCVLISAISKVPIKQNIGVTGSMDQFGSIQCVGGVNEKIIGFYNLCSHRGLDGTHGVLIPESNIASLNLPSAIEKDIEDGKFSIYSASHVDEVITIMTGMDCGIKEDDLYTDGSVYSLAQDKLLDYGGESSTGFFSKILGFFKK